MRRRYSEKKHSIVAFGVIRSVQMIESIEYF